ncbi:hypothetical protein D3C85_1816090 [compost metagenome]
MVLRADHRGFSGAAGDVMRIPELVAPVLVFQTNFESIGLGAKMGAQVVHHLRVDVHFRRGLATEFVLAFMTDPVGKAFKTKA